jgi:glycosyltransferase involved in cell wall biosynthesis
VSQATGILVPAHDAGALAAALLALAADADARRALGSAGRRVAAERFSLERMIGQYLAVYRGAA